MTNRRNNRTLLFSIVTMLYWFSLYTYVPFVATYAEYQGASHMMIGLILGVYGFTQMFLRIPLGIFSDIINQRKIFIITGIGLSLTGSLGMWFFSNPVLLLVFRSITGAAAASWVVFTVLFSSYFQERKATKAIGYINSFTYSGIVSELLQWAFFRQYMVWVCLLVQLCSVLLVISLG